MNLEKSSTTTSPYLLPLKLVILVGPKRSRCNYSNGLNVDTIFFDLKDFLIYFPNLYALQILFSSKLIDGIPIIKLCLINLSIK